MTVAVYPRLDELLRERKLTITDLQHQIQERYGLVFDPRTLDRLARPEPVQRTDLTIAGAAAVILGVGLGDLFAVEAIPVAGTPPPEDDYLDDEQTRRMFELLDRQDQGALDEQGQRELEALIDEYGRRFCLHHLERYSDQQGVSLEQAQREADRRIAEASGWLEQLEADPRHRRAFAERITRRGSAAPR